MTEYVITDNNLYSDYGYLEKVINLTLKHEKVDKACFSIIFVTEEEIRRINREYRNIDRVTDEGKNKRKNMGIAKKENFHF